MRALPPDPRSLALWRPTPVGGKKARPRVRGPGRLAYSRPPGARVALLRSPILPAARPRIAERGRGVQPQITPGGGPSRARGDSLMTADIPTLANQRTFLSWSDTGSLSFLPGTLAAATLVLTSRGGQ